MTNVPANIREMWTDLYKLFDKNYLMDGSDDAWRQFYLDCIVLYEKHGKSDRFIDGVMLVTDMIGDRLKEECQVE